jgi:hypothetical protein
MNWIARTAVVLGILPLAACGAPAPTQPVEPPPAAKGQEVGRAKDSGAVKREGRKVTTYPDAQKVVDSYIELLRSEHAAGTTSGIAPNILGYAPAGATEAPEQAAYLIAPGIDVDNSFVPTLLLWSPADGKILASRSLQSECKAVSGASIQWVNLDADDTPELFVELDAVCLSPERVDGYRLTRLLAFDLPSLDLILSQNGTVVLYGRDNVQATKRTYRLIPASGGKAASIEITDSTQSRSVSFDGASEVRIVSAELEPSDQKQLQPRRGVITCRFIDDAGRPIIGLRVPYETKTLNLFARNLSGMEEVTEHETTTNDAGICEIEYNRLGAILQGISHPDYYPIRLFFFVHPDSYQSEDYNQRFITDEVTDIVMKRRLEEVAMHWSGRRVLSLDLRNLPKELGVSFEVSPEKDREVNPREPAILGDLLFRVELIDENLPDGKLETLKERQAYNGNRRLTIEGRNGWKLRAAPEIPPERAPDEVYEAPLDEYRDALSFDGLEVPQHIFLSKNNGRRYGLLSEVSLTVDTFREIGTYKFSYRYRVQAEATGSRSLDRLATSQY